MLRPQDIVLTLVSTLALALLLFSHRHPLGWRHAAGVFALIAVSPLVLRALQHRWSNELTRFMATFLPPALGVLFFYAQLDTLCDLLNPALSDGALANMDLRVFGTIPGYWLEQRLPAAVVDALFVCYTSYYVWPVSIGLILFAQGQRRAAEFDRYILGYVLLMLGSYACYLAVPAIGPRFYLVGEYAGPIHATRFGQWFDALYRGAPYFRDCFPSGHTALTLYALYHARRLTPRWFWVVVGPGAGLIAATLVCRFHYGIDLICGAMLTVAAIVAADALHERLPALEVSRHHVAVAAAQRSR